MCSRVQLVRVIAAWVLVCVPVLAGADTIDVQVGDSLTDALAAASYGDVLLLEAGLYVGQGYVVPDGVSVLGEAGAELLVILESPGDEPFFVLEGVGSSSHFQLLLFRRAVGATGEVARGGAVVCENSSPQFLGCEFRDLTANYGGAVFCRAASSPQFFDCRFVNNAAVAVGGAVACVDNSSPLFHTCYFIENSAGAAGGAINAAANSKPDLQKCTLVRNACAGGSALTGWDLSDASATQNLWVENLGAATWQGDWQSTPSLSCSDLFDNVGGDWAGILADQAGVEGNISADPIFCHPTSFQLNVASPCAAAASSCGEIGAGTVACSGEVAIEEDTPLVTRFSGNYPNPFNPKTVIQFDVGQSGPVNLAVYDVAGHLVRQLLNETMTRGSHEKTWEGVDNASRPVAAGVYFLHLKTKEATATRRVTLVK